MVDGLTSLLEPMIMAVLGVVIGGLIVACTCLYSKWVTWYNLHILLAL